MKRSPTSLALRFTAGAAVVVAVGLVSSFFLLSSIYEREILRQFDANLRDKLSSLVAATILEPDRSIKLVRQGEIEARFQRPRSGWYWQISRSRRIVLSSPSMAGGSAIVVEVRESGAPTVYEAEGPFDEPLRIVSRRIRLTLRDNDPNPTAYVYTVGIDVQEIKDILDDFDRAIAISLGFLGLVLIGMVALQIRFGLVPLKRIPPSLAAIRTGKNDRLTGNFPTEVVPLVEEINALLDHNEKVVERARTHVGNLAHALKTPLAVLTNEASEQKTSFSTLVAEQTAAMRDQVDHHLARARAAARAGVIGARTSVMPVLDDLKRTLDAIHRDKGLKITVAGPSDAAFRGERTDLEEIFGNIMDNACKWARRRVKVKVKEREGAGGPTLVVSVEDDGPGLEPTERRAALKRGTRLDEETPGSGLGLSIVTDTVGLYEGLVTLDRSDLGGLFVQVELPGALAE